MFREEQQMITLLLLISFVICSFLNRLTLRRIERRVNLLTTPAPRSFPAVYDPNGGAALAFIAFTLFGFPLAEREGYCQEPRTNPPLQTMHIEPPVRAWYRNPDGSCVQCSIGMIGCHCNDLNAASLLWDTTYGPAERGGSNPFRVESYCNYRGIHAWSVTGQDNTIEWMKWSAKTGRFAAIGAGTQHFQTLYGYDPTTQEWFVCNNNSTNRVDRYSDRQFRELHAASGPWCVILEKPSSVPPQIVKWWK